jgi:6-pyruvoyltetrahydropterin/6-carboxytetrahydropterin synthase
MKGGEVDRARLIRALSFRASHRYGRPGWSDRRNREVFGEQAEAHEHEWSVEVHVEGPIDPDTGWVTDLRILDEALEALVGSWKGSELNRRIPAMASGGLQPSTENLARWIFFELEPLLPQRTSLVEVRVFEAPGLGASFSGPSGA